MELFIYSGCASLPSIDYDCLRIAVSIFKQKSKHKHVHNSTYYCIWFAGICKIQRDSSQHNEEKQSILFPEWISTISYTQWWNDCWLWWNHFILTITGIIIIIFNGLIGCLFIVTYLLSNIHIVVSSASIEIAGCKREQRWISVWFLFVSIRVAISALLQLRVMGRSTECWWNADSVR